MKRLHLAYALACLLGAGAPAFAQTAAGVADPQAAVPATTYASPLPRDTPAAPAGSPDQAWRAANATVGGRNAMSLTMPGMGSMSGHEMHGAAPAAPAAAQAPATGHVHHAGMQMGDAATADSQCMGGGHGDHAGMAMSAAGAGQQCAPGGGTKGCCDEGCGGDKCCCAGPPPAGDHAGHAGHAGMAMDHGCCDHKEAK